MTITTHFMAIGSLNYYVAKSKPPINGTYGNMQISQMHLQIWVPHHINHHPWQWTKNSGIVIRFAIARLTSLSCHVFCN